MTTTTAPIHPRNEPGRGRPRRTRLTASGLLGALLMSASVLLIPARATATAGTPGVDWGAAASLPPIPGPATGGPTLTRDDIVELSCIGETTCVSATERPTLHATGEPDEDGEYRYMVYDLSGAGGSVEMVAEHQSADTAWTPPAGRLQHGHTYVWRALGSADETDSWQQFIVDLRRAVDQPIDDLGPFSVGLGTGALLMSLAVPTGGAELGLGYSDPGPATTSMLPAGWSIGGEAITDIDLVQVESFADGATVVVHALDGTAVRYERTDDGAYVPPSLDGTDVSFAYPTLTSTASGWQAVDQTGRVSTFGPGGNLVSVDASAQDGYARAEYDIVADGGRLISVTDRTTGRTMSFDYRGDRGCRPPSGFDGGAGEQALLCTITGFDGTKTSLSYLDGRLARIESGGASNDIVYDAAGRIVELREPIAADAVAAGVRADDASVRWSIGYDDLGRVARVATPEPTAGADEIVRTYHYGPGTSTVNVVDDGAERAAVTVEFDIDDVRPTLQRNAAGATTRYVYRQDGSFLGIVDPNGQQTTYHRDSATSTTTMYGPAPSAWFDADGVPLPAHRDGVATQVQSSGAGAGAHATFRSADSFEAVRLITGPQISAPTSVDTSAAWQTTITADPAADTGDQLRIVASGIDASASTVVVNGTACSLDDGCTIDAGEAGRALLIADLHVPAGTSTIEVTIQRSTDGGTTWLDVAYDTLTGNDLPTTTTRNDVYRLGTPAVTTVEETVYADPSSGIVDRYLRDGAAVATLRHEALDPATDQWGRPTAIVRPSGLTTEITYWGGEETAQHPLTGETLAQTGQRRSLQIGDGAVHTTIYDDAGNPAATLVDGTLVEAATYDGRGRLDRLVTPSGTSEVIYGADGDPLRTDVISTLETGEVFTSTTSDLLGRTVEQIDVWGVSSQLTYDRVGNLVSVVTTTPDLSTTTRTYTWDAAGIVEDRIVAIDGSVVTARVTERDAAGTATAIEYSNGTSVRLVFDRTTGVRTATWTDAAGSTWTETVTSSTQGGRVLHQVLTSPTSTATFGFGYDPSSGALTDATLDVVGDGATSAEWTYTSTYPNGGCEATAHMLADGARGTTVATIDGTTTTTTTCYGTDGAPTEQTRTTDGETESVRLELDGGNVVAYDQVDLRYDATGNLVAADDGETSIEFTRGTDSQILERRTTPAETGVTVISRTASAGLTLDGNSDPASQSIELPGGVTVTIPFGDATTWGYLNGGGDVWFTTDAAGNPTVTTPILYSPDGELLTVGASGAAWKQGHNGISIDLATELVIFGARVYAPGLAAFTTADPLAHGGSTPYNYVNGDPINMVDPHGEAPQWVEDTAKALDSVPPWVEFLVVLAIAAIAFIPGVGPVLAAALTLLMSGYYIFKGVMLILAGDVFAGVLYIVEGVILFVSFVYLARLAKAGKGMLTQKAHVVGKRHVVPQKKWKGFWNWRRSNVAKANSGANPRLNAPAHADNLYGGSPKPLRSGSSQTVSASHSFNQEIVGRRVVRKGAMRLFIANIPVNSWNVVSMSRIDDGEAAP